MRNAGFGYRRRERLPIDFFQKFVIILRYIKPKGDLWERERDDE
jgi:hypothetical protein